MGEEKKKEQEIKERRMPGTSHTATQPVTDVLDQLPEGPIFIVMCFLVRIVDAIGFGAAITASSSILAKAFPNNVATVMGSLEVFSGLGLIVGPPLGGFLYQSFGYEVPFILLGCIVLLMIPLNLCILPSYEADPGEHSFWKLVSLPKVGLIAFIIISLSSCFGFLEPILSLFILEKNLRKWFLVFGNLTTAVCYMLLGPAPILHIKSQLWLMVMVLVVNGVSAGMSIIPTFPETLSCAYENGFEEGISTLGLVSGLTSAMWSVGTQEHPNAFGPEGPRSTQTPLDQEDPGGPRRYWTKRTQEHPRRHWTRGSQKHPEAFRLRGPMSTQTALDKEDSRAPRPHWTKRPTLAPLSEAEMGRRQCKSTYNIIKNKTTSKSSPQPTPRPDHCNVDKAEENDLKKKAL
ncbi:hypothetical protein STEG23_031945 [Scotinomys teguina]